MADAKISALTSYSNPDPVNDSIPIVDNTNSTTKKISRNNLLGITSTPVGINDIQTLTQKTLTSPTINGATLSGTLSGTYTLGGTPTFPASVVTLTGSQTLTNKILTSPTINGPTITNASITADALTGFSSANNGTVYGMSVTGGVITSAAVGSSSIATGAQIIDKTKNPYKFSVYLTSAQNTINGATRILYDTKEFDTGSNIDILTNKGRFTAPIAGFYQFNAVAEAALVSGFLTVLLYKNGSLFKNGQSSTAGSPNIVGSWCIQLAAGDFAEIFISSGSAVALGTGSNVNVFSGFLVSAT